jgi:hypothetical protein
MESIFASDSVKNRPTHKGGFSDWLELEGNTIETFISLAEADLANKKPAEQAYLEKFGRPAAYKALAQAIPDMPAPITTTPIRSARCLP